MKSESGLSSQQDQAPQDSGLTDFQFNAEETNKRINEAKEASEKVKVHLVGLNCKPASSDELEKILEDNTEGNISLERLEELAKKEDSISYVLENADCGYLDRDNLRDARYFTISEIAKRAEERVELLEKAKEEIKNFNGDQPALQRLYDEYSIKEKRLFGTDEKTGKVFLKKMSERDMKVVQKKFDERIERDKWFGSEISNVLTSGRTGIDIGVLMVSKDRTKMNEGDEIGGMGGFYIVRGECKGELNKIGLIAMPLFLDPYILKHEYAHFEDLIHSDEKRLKFDAFITEINSFFLAHPEKLSKENAAKVFENMKEIIVNDYVGKKISEMASLKVESEQLPEQIFENQKEKVERSIDIIERLYKKGFSEHIINSMLMHANTFEDIIQWENVEDKDLKGLLADEKDVTEIA